MSFEGLHPSDTHRPTASNAERTVFAALKSGLPAGWSAWHSLRIRDAASYLGEGDFVLADPQRGLLVLEVKGGRIEQRDGQWLQNGQRMEQPPLDQATRFVHRLVARLAEEDVRPPAFGAAVCFPDAEFVAQPTQDDLSGVVLGARDLAWPGEALPRVMERALPPARPAQGPWLAALDRLWGGSWVPYVPLGHRAAGRRVCLDESQLATLEGLISNPTVLISGAAGSGKTLLAAEAARRHAARGERVLLLCFTRSLSLWLREQLQPLGVDVHTVSAFARAIVEASGAPFPAQPDPAFWRALSLHAAELTSGGGQRGYTAVLVDEAQDLMEEDWLLISAIADKRVLWAFQDTAQGFWPDRQVPKGLFGTSFQLRSAHRCPAGVQALAEAYRGPAADHAAIAAAIADGSLAFVESPSRGALAEKIGAEIDRLLSVQFKLAEIGVVSIRGRDHADSVCKAPRFGRHEFVDSAAADMGERLVVDSFLRWKGLERPAIIVTDLVEGALDRREVRMYVALTRAVVAARIAGTAAELGADSVLALARARRGGA